MRRLSLAAILPLVAGLLTAMTGTAAAASTLIVDGDLACDGATYTTIQAAEDAAAPGDTIEVCPGTYAENVVVDVPNITIVGSGSGTDETVDTIVDGVSGKSMRFLVGGLSPADRTTVSHLRVTGGTGSGNAGNGIELVAASFMTFDDVVVTGNEGNGIAYNTGAAGADLRIVNSQVVSNGAAGIRLPSSMGSLDGLVVDHSSLSDNEAGIYMYARTMNPTFTDSSFNANGDAGIWGYASGQITIERVETNGNGSRGIYLYAHGAPDPGTVTMTDVIAHDNTGGCGIFSAAISVWAMDGSVWFEGSHIDSYDNAGSKGLQLTGQGGTLGGTIDDLRSVDNCDALLLYGRYSDIDGVTITDSRMEGADWGVRLSTYTGTVRNVLVESSEIVDNNFGFSITEGAAATNAAHGNNIVGNGEGVDNGDADDAFDATCNWWGAATGPSDVGPGTGDPVNDRVLFTPWLTAPAPAGPCLGPFLHAKNDVRDGLAAILPTGDDKDDKQIDKAIGHLERSIEPDLWADEMRPEDGKKVFREERNAVRAMEKVDADVSGAIAALAAIDRGIATLAIDDAEAAMAGGGDAKDLEKAARDLQKAYDELAKGDSEAFEGNADKAIEHYGKAWEQARKAIERL